MCGIIATTACLTTAPTHQSTNAMNAVSPVNLNAPAKVSPARNAVTTTVKKSLLPAAFAAISVARMPVRLMQGNRKRLSVGLNTCNLKAMPNLPPLFAKEGIWGRYHDKVRSFLREIFNLKPKLCRSCTKLK